MIHPASEENPGFLLWQVSTLWSRATSAALKPFGLNHPQFVILANLDALKGERISEEEIAQRVVLDQKPTTHLLRSLELKGLITQEGGYVLLTSVGTETLSKILPVIEKADTAFFASIGSEMTHSLQILKRDHFSKI